MVSAWEAGRVGGQSSDQHGQLRSFSDRPVGAVAALAPPLIQWSCGSAIYQCCSRNQRCVCLGPSVWTGRALQAESDDLERLVLRFCIRPIDGAFELLAIMDIRARSISFASRPRRPDGPPDRERAGETFLHLLFPTRRPRRESRLLPSGSA